MPATRCDTKSLSCIGLTSFFILTLSPALFGQIPQIAVGGTPNYYVTIVQVTNANSLPIAGRLEYFSDSGSELLLIADGQPPSSSTFVNLEVGETKQIVLSGGDELIAGWLQASFAPSMPAMSAIIQLKTLDQLLSEIGVIPGRSNFSAHIPFDNSSPQLGTGVALINPSSSGRSAGVTIDIYTEEGKKAATTQVTLPPRGHMARFLTELFPNLGGLDQGRGLARLTCTAPCTQDFVATAMRLSGSNLALIQTMDGFGTVSVPQVAFGGDPGGTNAQTILYVANPSWVGWSGNLSVLDDTGNAVPFRVDGDSGTQISMSLSLASFGSRRIVLSGTSELRSGWLKVSFPNQVLVTAVFRIFDGGKLVSEVGATEAEPVTRGSIPVFVTKAGRDTGVAFVNRSNNARDVQLKLFGADGLPVRSTSVHLNMDGHLAKYVSELFSEVKGKDFLGTLCFEAPNTFQAQGGVSALALGSNGQTLTSSPINDRSFWTPALSSLTIDGYSRNPVSVAFNVNAIDLDQSPSKPDVVALGLVYPAGTGDGYFVNEARSVMLGTVRAQGAGQSYFTNEVAGRSVLLTGFLGTSARRVSGVWEYPGIWLGSGAFTFELIVLDETGNASDAIFANLQ